MIGSAIERGSVICAFDEHGMTLFSKAKGSGPNDGLVGFSGSTVTARYGSVIYTYDEKGMSCMRRLIAPRVATRLSWRSWISSQPSPMMPVTPYLRHSVPNGRPNQEHQRRSAIGCHCCTRQR
jgi:hypothetical protein